MTVKKRIENRILGWFPQQPNESNVMFSKPNSSLPLKDMYRRKEIWARIWIIGAFSLFEAFNYFLFSSKLIDLFKTELIGFLALIIAAAILFASDRHYESRARRS